MPYTSVSFYNLPTHPKHYLLGKICASVGAKSKYVAYGSLYLTVPGVYATAPIISAWMANNSEPYYRRATSIAMGFVATNAVSNYILPTMSDVPTLHIG